MFHIGFFVLKNERFVHSLIFGEQCERIAQVAHQKWANCSFFEQIAHLLIIHSFFWKKKCAIHSENQQISNPGDSFETFCIFCMFLTVFFLILCPRANCPLHSLFNCSFFKRNLSDLLMSLFRSLMSKEQLWVIASCCLWQKSNGSDLLF